MRRKTARELALHLIYEQEFTHGDPEEAVAARLEPDYYNQLKQENTVYSEQPDAFQTAYIQNVVSGVAGKKEYLNSQIRKFAIGWDVKRISRIVVAALQLAMYEIRFVEDVPTGVAISEAVRLAKLYDGEESGPFVNGILGSFAKAPAEETAPEIPESVSAEPEAEPETSAENEDAQ